mmetsp:Transcript_31647/g.84620  ORF Transcript_31647/g.84620 Transcript_31647/m.84620 type:complete len:176 (+) Transcript_31647:95-622(+)
MGCGASSSKNSVAVAPVNAKETVQIAPMKPQVELKVKEIVAPESADDVSQKSTERDATSPAPSDNNSSTTDKPVTAAPLDVDAIQLPCNDPNSAPHWEREREVQVCKRPESSSGRLVVHKTEKLRALEAEAKKKREPTSDSQPKAPRSGLPPRQDRKKIENRVETFQLIDEEASS